MSNMGGYILIVFLLLGVIVFLNTTTYITLDSTLLNVLSGLSLFLIILGFVKVID